MHVYSDDDALHGANQQTQKTNINKCIGLGAYRFIFFRQIVGVGTTAASYNIKFMHALTQQRR